MKSTNCSLKEAPKFIVFLSCLFELFKFCPACKGDDPLITTKVVGTMIEMKTVCAGDTCNKRESIWRSQPCFEGTEIPACNVLLPFATLSAGGTGTKILRIFDHMGLAHQSLNKFLKHQRVI